MYTFLASCHGCNVNTCFDDEQQLKQHMLDVHSEWKHTKGWQCNVCDKNISSYSRYIRHIAVHFPKKYKAYHCSKCKYSASTKGDVNRHLKQHAESTKSGKHQQSATKTTTAVKSSTLSSKSKPSKRGVKR